MLGPAADGGYVLIGLRHSEPSLFHGIPWSSNRVLTLTRRRFALAGLECTELPMRWDADRPEDVRRWLKGGQKFRGVRQQQM